MALDSHEQRPSSVDPRTEWEPAIRRLARRYVECESDVDDLVQQVWLRWVQHPPHPGHSMLPWLASVVRREFLYRARGDRRRRDREWSLGLETDLSVAKDEVEMADLRDSLIRILDGVAEPYRTVLRGIYVDGCSSQRLARQLNVPLETIRTRHKRGIALLRTRLRAENDDERRRWLDGLLTLWQRSREWPRLLRCMVLILVPMAGFGWLRFAVGEDVARPTAVSSVEVESDEARIEVAGERASSGRRFDVGRSPIAGPTNVSSGASPISGRVVRNGSAVHGARVLAIDGAFPHLLDGAEPKILAETRSAQDGTFELPELGPETAILALHAEDRTFGLWGRPRVGREFVSWRTSLPSSARDEITSPTQPIEVSIDDECEFRVQVVGPGRRPLPGAKLLLKGSRYTLRRRTTDAQGLARFRWLAPGMVFYLGVDAQDHGHEVHGPFRVDGDTATCTIELAPPESVDGVVRDADGRPIRRARVKILCVEPHGPRRSEREVSPPPSEWQARVTPRPIKTNASGRFAFDGLAPGIYALEYRLPRRAQSYGRRTVRAGERDVILSPSDPAASETVVRVLVRDRATALPLDHATLIATSSDHPRGARRVATGVYEFRTPLPVGSWDILASVPGYAQERVTVELEGGVEELELALDRTRSLQLRIEDGRGEPIEGARIAAWDRIAPALHGASEFAGDWELTDASGRATFEQLPVRSVQFFVFVEHLRRPFRFEWPARAERGPVVLRLPIPTAEERVPVRLDVHLPTTWLVTEAALERLALMVWDVEGLVVLDEAAAHTSDREEGALHRVGLRLDRQQIASTRLAKHENVTHPKARAGESGAVALAPLSLPAGEHRVLLSYGGRAAWGRISVPARAGLSGTAEPAVDLRAQAVPPSARAELDALLGAEHLPTRVSFSELWNAAEPR